MWLGGLSNLNTSALSGEAKRRSRENERRSREEAAPYRGFPAFLAPSNCLIKNRQATQASVEETRGFMSRPEKFKNAA